jgi:hypothetical protein
MVFNRFDTFEPKQTGGIPYVVGNGTSGEGLQGGEGGLPR